MTRPFFNIYIGTMAVLIGGYLFLPAQSIVRFGWQTGVGWLAAGFIVGAIRRNKLSPPMAWWFCALGIFLNASGIAVDFLSRQFFGFTENDFPLPADAFWLMLYPALVVGLSILARKRSAGQDWSTTIDALIIIVGLSLLSWIFVVSASPHKASSNGIGLFVVVAYPVGDLAVMGVLIRLLMQRGRNIALTFISLGLALFLCGDLAWTMVFRFNLVLTDLDRTLLEVVFLLAFACFGAAAIHPDARKIAEPIPERASGISLVLLLVLAMTSLVPSALLLYQANSGAVTNGVAIGVSSGGLFLLVVVRVVGLLRKVESQARQLSKLSRVDELTGLYNRRAWMSELHIALESARRTHLPLSSALIDFDRFKVFNDTFGHQAGDALLRDASKAWLDAIRLPDILGRYGGEEFILVLPNTDQEGGVNLLERLRPLMPSNQTFSSGLAQWDGVEGVERLLLRADQALFRAKEQGRNRTVLAENQAAPQSKRDGSLAAAREGLQPATDSA